MKNTLIAVLGVAVVIIVGVFIYLFWTNGITFNTDDQTGEVTGTPTGEQIATTTDQTPEEFPKESVIGTSAGGEPIHAYHYGKGEKELLFVGGIHGGYSWNTALVAYDLIDYLEANPDKVPQNLRVTVVPVANPDGLKAVVGTTSRFSEDDVPESSTTRIAGRFNANEVDLNRNFDCDWKESATWQSRTVSGGDKAFSEPEAAALRDFVSEHKPAAVLVWYSAAGGVFASNCHGDVLPETRTLTELFAKASGYKAFTQFDFYEITGDMVNWLAKEGIPAISVLLTTHEVVEWEKNRPGIEAVLQHYAE